MSCRFRVHRRTSWPGRLGRDPCPLKFLRNLAANQPLTSTLVLLTCIFPPLHPTDSDILSFTILGQPVIVLNSVAAAQELLDKRGVNYSDRPRFALFEVMGWSGTLTFLRWGKRFQMHRRLIQSSFTKPAILKYREFQTNEAHRLVQGVMRDSGKWEDSLRRFATAIVLGIGFGVSITDEGDPYVQMAVDASYALGHGGAPAGTPVDFFPPSKDLPIVRHP